MPNLSTIIPHSFIITVKRRISLPAVICNGTFTQMQQWKLPVDSPTVGLLCSCRPLFSKYMTCESRLCLRMPLSFKTPFELV